MRRIAVINQKGGVGKTTTTANVGAALASLGHRILLVDLDPQAHLTLHYGIDVGHEQPTTYDILIGSTHTHSAPDCYAMPNGRGGHTGSLEYMDMVCTKAAEAINAAIDNGSVPS